MAKHKRTEAILDQAIDILANYHPMTVRQVYYQLVSRQIIDNNRSQYQAVSNILVDARKSGVIPWGWVEDRLRKPRNVSMWNDLADFAHTAVHSYRRDVWAMQPTYLECWLEKDALSGIFEELLAAYSGMPKKDAAISTILLCSARGMRATNTIFSVSPLSFLTHLS